MVHARRAADRADRAAAARCPATLALEPITYAPTRAARRHQVALLRREHARLAPRARAGRRRRAARQPARPRARVPDRVVLPRPRRRGLDARRSPTTCSTRSRAASCSPSPTVREEPIELAALGGRAGGLRRLERPRGRRRAPRRRAPLRARRARARASSRRCVRERIARRAALMRIATVRRATGRSSSRPPACRGPLRERHEEIADPHRPAPRRGALGGLLRGARRCPRPTTTSAIAGGRNGSQLARMLAALEPLLGAARARRACSLYGDTNSTLAGRARRRRPRDRRSLHVEAGHALVRPHASPRSATACSPTSSRRCCCARRAAAAAQLARRGRARARPSSSAT